MQWWWFGTAYVVPNWEIRNAGAKAIADKLPDSKLTTLHLGANGRFSACWVISWCAIEGWAIWCLMTWCCVIYCWVIWLYKDLETSCQLCATQSWLSWVLFHILMPGWHFNLQGRVRLGLLEPRSSQLIWAIWKRGEALWAASTCNLFRYRVDIGSGAEILNHTTAQLPPQPTYNYTPYYFNAVLYGNLIQPHFRCHKRQLHTNLLKQDWTIQRVEAPHPVVLQEDGALEQEERSHHKPPHFPHWHCLASDRACVWQALWRGWRLWEKPSLCWMPAFSMMSGWRCLEPWRSSSRGGQTRHS